MKEIDNEVVDLFHEELSKKERKEAKKIAKIKARNKKKEIQKEKLLEQIEDREFAKKLEEKQQEKLEETKTSVIDELSSFKTTQFTREKKNEKVSVKKYRFLNFLLGLFLIILFIVSVDYAIFTIVKEKELEIIITSSFLCGLSIFYSLSILVKKEGFKKFLQIISTIAITLYMCYELLIK